MSAKTLKYIIKRVIFAIFTIWVVITLTFFIMHIIPGGPFTSEKAVSAAVQAAMEKKYGLDKPLFTQYLTYLGDVVRFRFGPSLKMRGQMVIDIINNGMKVSVRLGLIAAGLATLFGTVLGSLAALKRNTVFDRIIMVLTTAFVSMPSFIIGTLLLIVFAVKTHVFPANGATAAGYVLPVLTLMFYPMSYITRLTRSSMLDVLGQDYIRTAKAKGVSKTKIIFGHALKNALIPVITYVGPLIASILTGSLVVEKIFTIGGLGSKFVDSITNRDYPMIMGTTIFLAFIMVLMNLISDLVYKLVDPRIQLD
ncbi:MAG TPA: ABC transporter permease [Lachnospiraceae bacterium]|nr:ABC transporter permease [Lachnospiraceae bacterium]